jgi:hypothetical protein
MIYTLSGVLLILTVGFPDIRRFLAAIYCRAAFCLSAMKFASRCRWGLPEHASRRLKSAWLTIYGRA